MFTFFHGEFKVMKKPSKISGPFHAKARSNFEVFLQIIFKIQPLVFLLQFNHGNLLFKVVFSMSAILHPKRLKPLSH